jgi:hypothetical protein
MVFPDISLAVWALREHPHEFFMRNDWLEQKRSRHRFKFDQFGLVFVQAGGSGPRRLICGDEAEELISAFEDWRREYWISAESKRAFGRRLRRLGLWRRLQHWLERRLPERQGERALAVYARAFDGDRPPDEDPGREPPPGRPPAPRPTSPVRGGIETVHVP